jgi:hypothetical protein
VGRQKNSAEMIDLRDRPLVDCRILARSLLLLHAGKVWKKMLVGAL